jgi:ABC-2 type transport system permease protein
MREFIVFTRKEIYHIFRDRWTMMILLILPILMIILFGFGINTEMKNTTFSVYDPSRDVVSQEIVNKLATSEYFVFKKYLDTPEEIEQEFLKEKTGLVLVFSDNFSHSMYHTGDAQIQMIADGTDPNTASTVTGYASSIIGLYQQKLMNNMEIPYRIVPEIKLLYNPTMKGAYSTVPGVIGMVLMLICAMMTSVSIAREKEFGSMEVILVSPMKPILIILSKIIPYFILSVVNLTTVLLLSYFVLQVPINGSLILLIAFSLIFIVVSLALGLVISSIAQSQIVALLISGMALMMPTMMLSGLMFPIENMPKILQWFSHIIPAKWYIIGLRDIMIKGVSISSVLPEIAILSIMAIFLVIVALKKFKIRLE